MLRPKPVAGALESTGRDQTRLRGRRRFFVIAALAVATSLGSMSPGSPLVSSTNATIYCGLLAYGGKLTDTSAWGQANLFCTGTIGTSHMDVYLNYCQFDFAGVCGSWVKWKGGIMCYRAEYGPGNFYLPVSGTGHCSQGSLWHGSIYSLTLRSTEWSSLDGEVFTDYATTQQWRQ